MSQPRFGERYFSIRRRIADVVGGILELARDTGTDLGNALSHTAFEKDLGSPFLFVVCGEVNAGKSSLINGLFGRELCKVNILPETDRVIWYRHGAPPRDVESTDSLEERYRPIEFLRDFNLVDTPGTNSIVKGHQQITERFLPVADLILFVFPVTNPWGAATWNLISSLPVECLNHVAFIVQQADQRDDADIKVILEHMADLSIKRIGVSPRIFPVSGKMAFEAKRAGAFGEKDYLRSGFPKLEEFIGQRVCDSPERRAALQTWRNNASLSLRKIEDQIEDQTRVLGGQNHFLASLEEEIDEMRERLVLRLPKHLTGVAEVFETEAVWVTGSLKKWLGLLRSVFRVFAGDKTGSETERLFIERLRSAVEEVAESDGKDVVTACKAHWEDLGKRVEEAIGTVIDEQEPVDSKLEQARQRFVQRIGRAAHQGIGNLHVRKELERELRRRNIALKSFTATTLLVLIAGAICGIFGFPWLPWIFCGVALLFAFTGAIIAVITRIRITRDFQNSLLDTCGAFAEALRTDYENALRIFFQDYTTCLNSIRSHLAKEKLAIEPKLNRWHDLFLTLKTIEQDI
ncbi:MAG: 50S ribosome-binding GTPase [Akkermansiaceae bacterium]|nr:50S ribosome-binding GTPase [Akkermansiaceae bacterium]MDP4646458.1 50S ribosome-binding GTPase [Akkermansiaceae bacterium]MDP4720515.1 50S ribosome-binding GTPase [Akkermansiaceae bacterium]MDP4780065.1 50S ribosome-binding GTPase [Akkermansiaceae bacterium]MDP4896230.1 50S ribosome-binding GTPase [Akkermansiaceae bacterium]